MGVGDVQASRRQLRLLREQAAAVDDCAGDVNELAVGGTRLVARLTWSCAASPPSHADATAWARLGSRSPSELRALLGPER